MLQIFYGLTIANMLLLSVVFALGLNAYTPAGEPGDYYVMHTVMAVGAGLVTCLTHVAMYMYTMATSKWLGAATDKANITTDRFVEPARTAKRKMFFAMATAIGITTITMFAGAATDTIESMPDNIHLILAITTIALNLACALVEYRVIKEQGALMDGALALFNK